MEGKRFNREVSAKARKDTWEDITNKINATYLDAIRDNVDVEKKWWALNGQGREEIAAHKKIRNGTGEKPYKLVCGNAGPSNSYHNKTYISAYINIFSY